MDIKAEETPTRICLTTDRATIEDLRERFKYHPPDYWRSPSYQLYKETQDDPKPKGWDGYLHLVHRAEPGRPYHAFMQRGHKDALIETCREVGYTIRGMWLRSPLEGITVDDVPPDIIQASFELDHHQRSCIVSLLAAGIGVVRVATSGGKTAIFAALAAMIKLRIPSARILYVASTERLVSQGFLDMKGFLPEWDITQAGGNTRKKKKGEDPNAIDPRTLGKDMVVATVAMMSRNLLKLHSQGFFKTFTVLLVDECHHAVAKTWSEVIRLTPAFFRFGASDTVKDERKEDHADMLAIRGLLGPLRDEVGVTPLIETGRVAKPILHLIDPEGTEGLYDHLSVQAAPDTPAWCYIEQKWVRGVFKHPAKDSPLLDKHGEPLVDSLGQPLEPPNITGYHTIDLEDRGEMDVESRWCLLNRVYDIAIIRNKVRNGLIGDWATYFAKEQGYPTLVVATRNLHVLILEDMLRRRGNEVEVLTGEDTSKKRDTIFRWLVEKEGRVLVSPLVKEGVSIPKLRGGVIADVVTSPDLARQLIGRLIRAKATGLNEAHLAWFIDRWYKSARKGCLALFAELEKIRGYSYHWPCMQPGQPAMLYKEADFT